MQYSRTIYVRLRINLCNEIIDCLGGVLHLIIRLNLTPTIYYYVVLLMSRYKLNALVTGGNEDG